MQLLDAIKSAAAPHKFRKANTFLYGQNKNTSVFSDQAEELIRSLNLEGDDYEFLGYGQNTIAIGNKDQVLKVDIDKDGLGFKQDFRIEDIPEGLAAKVMAHGHCNGVAYSLCERLNTERQSTLEKIIPFLFKARDKGVVYWDPRPSNFGYDQAGELKVLDHEHFQTLGKPARNFEESIKRALDDSPETLLPLITSDDRNTYAVFSPKKADAEENKLYHKRLLTSLEAIGIKSTDIESIKTPPVIKIERTQIICGTPPQAEKLADCIDRVLKIAVKPESKAEEFIQNLSGLLRDVDSKPNPLLAALPSPTDVAGMNRQEFLRFYDGFTQSVKKSGAGPRRDSAKIDNVFDAYFKMAFPSPVKKATPHR